MHHQSKISQHVSCRNKGSKRVLIKGLKFYPEQFSSSEPIFEEGCSSRVLCKTNSSIKKLSGSAGRDRQEFFVPFLEEGKISALLHQVWFLNWFYPRFLDLWCTAKCTNACNCLVPAENQCLRFQTSSFLVEMLRTVQN